MQVSVTQILTKCEGDLMYYCYWPPDAPTGGCQDQQGCRGHKEGSRECRGIEGWQVDWEPNHIGPQPTLPVLTIAGVQGVLGALGHWDHQGGVEGVRGALWWQMDWEPNHIGPNSRFPALPLVPLGEWPTSPRPGKGPCWCRVF